MSKKKLNEEPLEQGDSKGRALGFAVPEDVYAKLRVLAFVTDSSVSQVVRDLISDNLDKKLSKYKNEVQDFIASLKSVE